MDAEPAAGKVTQVVCAGSYKQMGQAQGRNLRSTILSAIDTCLKDPTFREGRPWWVPNWLVLFLGKRLAASKLSVPLRRDFAEMHQRLEGLAEGAGLDLRLAYFASAFEPILASKSDHSTVPACSALAVRGKRSATGDPMVVRNFDYVPVIQPYLVARDDRPAGRLRSLQFTVATNCGAFDGMNEAGLCITYNYGYVTDDAKPSGPVSFLIVEALERCKTVNEAAALIASRPRWGGAILMLADAEGDIASLELSSTDAALRRPDDGSDVIFHTNKFLTTQMRAVQVDERAIFTKAAHESLRGHRVLESAEVRYARLSELLSGNAPLSLDDLSRIMSDHGADGVARQNTVCVHGPYQRTLASVHFLPKQRKMRVDFATACGAKHCELGF